MSHENKQNGDWAKRVNNRWEDGTKALVTTSNFTARYFPLFMKKKQQKNNGNNRKMGEQPHHFP
jgi:hypothetical protein